MKLSVIALPKTFKERHKNTFLDVLPSEKNIFMSL